MRTYSPSSLLPHEPKSPSWALAWARRLAGDVPTGDGSWPTHSLEDEEWQAWLQATVVPVSTDVYYRPHEAAARAISANPYWSERLSLMGLSQEFRSAEQVAGAIRQAGSWIDRLITEKSGLVPTQGVQLWPGF